MEDQFMLLCVYISICVCIKQVHESWLQEYMLLSGKQRLNSTVLFEYVHMMYMRDNLYA